jgi:hypothetical protein
LVGECLDDVVHIAKDRALRLVTNQQVPTPQAIGTWLRRLGKDNQGIKALRKANKTLLKATLNKVLMKVEALRAQLLPNAGKC